MQKIILSISDLNKSNWTLIYRFIKEFYTKNLEYNVFNLLQKKATLRIASTALNKDVYSSYGVKLNFATLPLACETTFSIIYLKPDDKEDFSDIVPFFSNKA